MDDEKDNLQRSDDDNNVEYMGEPDGHNAVEIIPHADTGSNMESSGEIVNANTGNALLSKKDDSYSLPVIKEIKVDDEDFKEVVRGSISSEVSDDVIELIKSEQIKPKRWQKLIFVLSLIIASLTAYYSFPQMEKLTDAKMKIWDKEFPGITRLSPHYRLYSEASEKYNNKKFFEAQKKLKPVVKDIVNASGNENYEVALLYFTALRECMEKDIIPKDQKDAREMIKTLVENNPDSVCWKQFDYLFAPDRERLTDIYNVGYVKKDRRKSDRDQIDKLMEKLNKLKGEVKSYEDQDDGKDLLEFIDLEKAKLLTCKWILYGTTDDDYGDPGVADREKALEIAKEHKNSTHKGFWEVRKKIAAKILIEHTWGTGYYWDGDSRWSHKYLKDEIEECDNRLEAGK